MLADLVRQFLVAGWPLVFVDDIDFTKDLMECIVLNDVLDFAKTDENEINVGGERTAKIEHPHRSAMGKGVGQERGDQENLEAPAIRNGRGGGVERDVAAGERRIERSETLEVAVEEEL